MGGTHSLGMLEMSDPAEEPREWAAFNFPRLSLLLMMLWDQGEGGRESQGYEVVEVGLGERLGEVGFGFRQHEQWSVKLVGASLCGGLLTLDLVMRGWKGSLKSSRATTLLFSSGGGGRGAQQSDDALSVEGRGAWHAAYGPEVAMS